MRKAANSCRETPKRITTWASSSRSRAGPAEAEAGFRQALIIRPDYAEAHNNLGSILREQGRLADAEASYRQAASLKAGLRRSP